MPARKRYARSIEHAFDRLLLDGRDLTGTAAYQHFRKMAASGPKGAAWAGALERTLFDLVIRGGTSLLVTTSGTTGPPRHVRISRRDLVMSARITADVFGLKAGDRVLHCLPSEFIAGKMMLVRAMALGLDLHAIDPRGGLWSNLKVNDRFRFAAMVPLQLYRALQEDRARVERQFDTILLGGGPVSDALREDLQGLATAVFQGYGSTETVTHVALRRLNGDHRQDLYEALGEVTFSRDPRGCLVVLTPHLSVKQHMTNDIVRLVDDRHFEWLGRYDNVILSGGRKIFPERLEERTAGSIPYPHYFTAYNDDRLGEGVMLVLETDRPQDEVLPEVLEGLAKVLDEHELPRRITAIRAIPRTANGKIIRAR